MRSPSRPPACSGKSATKPLNVRIYGEFTLPANGTPLRNSAVDIDESDELTWSAILASLQRRQVAERGRLTQRRARARRSSWTPATPTIPPASPTRSAPKNYLRELERVRNQRQHCRNLLVITLNSDHTNGTRPGSPTPRAMVADDDLALGRIVEAVSKSRFWLQQPDPGCGRRRAGRASITSMATAPSPSPSAPTSAAAWSTPLITTTPAWSAPFRRSSTSPPRPASWSAPAPCTSIFTAERGHRPVTSR